MSFDDYLFRYRVSSENAIEAFKEDRLYFSTPENFNDPYDSLFYIDKESFIGAIKTAWHENLEESIRRKYTAGMPEAAQKLLSERIMALMNEPEYQNRFFREIFGTIEELKENVRKNLKIICFSEDHLSTLMWAYYAGNHKGFCLMYEKEALREAKIFDSQNNAVENSVDLLKVDYKPVQSDLGPYLYHYIPEKRFLVNGLQNEHKKLQHMVRNVMQTKSVDWEKEHEWRILPKTFDIGKANSISYLSIRASAVFLGSQMNIEDKYKLVQIARKKHIAVFEVWRNDDAGRFQFNFCKANLKEIRDEYSKWLRNNNHTIENSLL